MYFVVKDIFFGVCIREWGKGIKVNEVRVRFRAIWL